MPLPKGRIYPVPNEGQSVPSFGIDPGAIKIKTIPMDTARENYRVEMTGTFLYAVQASSKTVQIDVGFQDTYNDKIPFKEGQFISGVRFDHVYIDCDASAGGYITFIYGVEQEGQLRIENPASQFQDISIVKASTLSTSADVTVVGAAAAAVVVAANANRREVLLTNLNTNNITLRIGDSNTDATHGIPLPPGGQITLETTDAIYAFAPVTDEDIAILEIED